MFRIYLRNWGVQQDALWSLQTLRQLYGRIVRHGQMKNCIVYILIVEKSFDVTMHRLSATKGIVMDRFIASDLGSTQTPSSSTSCCEC